MDFFLNFHPASPPKRLNYRHPLLLTGSCFSEHMAGFLKDHRFNVLSQPNGVVFNPLSIAANLERIMTNSTYSENELYQYHELWHSWDHHGSFNSTNQEAVLKGMNDALKQSNALLAGPETTIIITLGSATVYELNDGSGKLVANCHKYPASTFKKRFLEVNEIVAAYEKVMALAGDKMIYFTVSPVRHVRDGLVENNVSKGILLQAVYQLCKKYGNCYYFPAYEIVIDELRDHRFYEADLVHPNKHAVNYVWQRFTETCMDDETRLFVKEMGELNAMLSHRILHEGTEAHRKFEEAKAAKEQAMRERYDVKMR